MGNTRSNAVEWLVPILVIASVAVVVALGFDRGWLPHDDGYLAMSAERVVKGEHPHADFDEIYTGGLTYLNAWTLKAFGMHFLALRIPYLVALTLFVGSVYAVGRRFFTRLHSALIAAATVFLGPYMTSSPMPSSYNVFVAGVALFLILKYFESGSRWWVASAGFISGLGVLAKTTGLYLILGVGIGLVAFHAMRRRSGVDPLGRVLLIGAASVVTLFVSPNLTLSRFVILVLPVWLVVYAVFRLEPPAQSTLREPGSIESLIPYTVGVALPLVAYGMFLATRGILSDTLDGLVAVPRLFVGELVRDTSHPVTLAIPLVVALVVWRIRNPLRSLANSTLSLLLAAAAGIWFLIDPASQLSVLLLLFSWTPMLLSVCGVALAHRSRYTQPAGPIVVATMAVAICMQLVRFPTSNQWYVFYSLPLAVVGFMILMGRREWPRRPFAVASLVVVAAVIGVAGQQGRIFASGPLGSEIPFVELEGDRGRLEVPAFYDYYNDLQSDPSVDNVTLAGPDTPEIYFLLDLPPSGRSAFPLISRAQGEEETMLDSWERMKPDTVIVNTIPPSSDLDSEFVAVVAASCSGPRVLGPLRLYLDCQMAR